LFSQTPANPAPAGPFIILSGVESTNNYAMAKLHAGLLEPGTSLMALEQTAGKGQRGKQWLSKSGENITMSTVFAPSSYFSADKGSFLTGHPFLLSASMALACYDFIKGFGIQGNFIKWPNDVYSGDRKAAGILIENMLRGLSWEWAVVGTGVNINQHEFPGIENKAVSVSMLTGKKHDVGRCGKILQKHLASRFADIQERSAEEIMNEYNSHLYKKDQEVRLKKESMLFTTRVQSVSLNGELITRDTMERKFNVGEVEFV
jgi:BirA family biotin operon repressor/biotin-[acetyl-CoA-carboxylase] ligase